MGKVIDIGTAVTDLDRQVWGRYKAHKSDDEMCFTPLEYNSIRKLGRDVFKIETDPAILKTGVWGYKEWTDEQGVANRVAVRCKRG